MVGDCKTSKHGRKQYRIQDMFLKMVFANVSGAENAFNMFVSPQGYTQYVLVRNTTCKHNF